MPTKADKLSSEKACKAGMIDTLVDEHRNLIPAAIWLVNELEDKKHNLIDGPIIIAPVITEVNAPRSAAGQRLSSEVLGIMRAAI